MIILFWITCAIVAAVVGGRNGRGGTGFLLGLIFGPLGIVLAFFIRGQRRECPACKELIHKDANRCPRCQTDLSAANIEAKERAKKISISTEVPSGILWMVLIFVLVLVIGFAGLM